MNIGFIGAGKVGCSLGRYFVEHAQETGGAEEPYKRQESSLNAVSYTHLDVYKRQVFFVILMLFYQFYAKPNAAKMEREKEQAENGKSEE